MQICPICNSNFFGTNPNKEEYQYCENCKTNIKKSLDNFTHEIYDDVGVESILKMLKNDKTHYDDFLYSMFTYDNFRNYILKPQFDNIYAFGGGLPKLESALLHNKIIVYDACSDGYYKHIPNFNKIYNYDKIIEFRNYQHDLTNNFYTEILSSLKYDSTDLLTFIHFLEHLIPDLLVKTLNDLFKLKQNMINKTFLIYQPNISMERESNWCHQQREHLTLIPIDAYATLLHKIGFNILHCAEYKDDLIIAFN